jgi:hypothetical protein
MSSTMTGRLLPCFLHQSEFCEMAGRSTFWEANDALLATHSYCGVSQCSSPCEQKSSLD